MKNTILCLSFVLTAASVAAQDGYYRTPEKLKLSLGAEAGLNLSTTTSDDEGYAETNKYRSGAKAGLLVNADFNGRLDIRAGLYYSMKGVSYYKTSQYTSYNVWFGEGDQVTKLRISYLELPLSLLVRLGQRKNFYIGPGAYIAYAVGGKEQYNETGFLSSRNIFKDYDGPYYASSPKTYNRLDYGVQASVGYRLPLGFFVQAQFSKGLAQVIAVPNNTFTNNFGCAITAGWLIGFRKKQA